MPRILIATDQPNAYPTGVLAKHRDSLREIARSVKQLPLIWGSHNGRQTGIATGLEYRENDGIGKLYAVVSDRIPEGWGASLQYTGEVVDGLIKMMIDRSLHLAILPNPRDRRTIYADSNMTYQIFRDSADTETQEAPNGPVTVETPPAQATDSTPQPTTTTASSEPETVDVPPELITAILNNSKLVEKIVAGLASHLAPATDTPAESATPTSTPAPAPTPRITYRVPTPAPAPAPRSIRPVQHKPKALN